MSFSSEVREELYAVKSPNHCRRAEYEAIGEISHGEPIVKNSSALKKSCCRRAYLRGAFIASGTISNPIRGYHLEFVLPSAESAEKLLEVLTSLHLPAKISTRKSQIIVYVKESESIALALNNMRAHKSLLSLENMRIEKEFRNTLNRKINFETANINKTVDAAQNQLHAIGLIQREGGLEQLPDNLAEVARLRLIHDTASLEEIGKMLDPPISKSGVNHRLRKICKIAREMYSIV